MSRILPVLVSLIMLVGVGGGGYAVLFLLRPKPEQAVERPAGLSVFAEQVVRDDLVFTVEAQGEVRPQREILVAPQISAGSPMYRPISLMAGSSAKVRSSFVWKTLTTLLGVVRAQSGVASAEQRLAREQAEAEIARQDLESLGITDSSPLARASRNCKKPVPVWIRPMRNSPTRSWL